VKVERRDGRSERHVVIGMVVSRAVLGPIAAKWVREGLFPSRWANIVATWCIEHYSRYKKPPGRDIAIYFESWSNSGRDKDEIGAVEDFLESLSEEYKRLKENVSPDYLLDQATLLFTRTSITRLRDKLEIQLESGEVVEAAQEIESYRKVEVGLGAGVDFTTEEEIVVNAFEQRGEDLITYPDALGNFFKGSLGRDQFVSVMAKEKGGKSFALQDLAWRGVEQGRKVAYFEVGDNSQHQVIRRFASRASGMPIEAGSYDYPVELDDPRSGSKIPQVDCERRIADQNLTARDAMESFEKFHGLIRLSCHPNSSISVRGIEAVIDQWQREDWVPDIVVIDYADILAPLDGRAETRDQINANWKAMRALSQRLHILVVTATQTDADSYSTHTLRRDNFSEDKRKYAHVTGMVGINQDDKEKEAGIFRLNWVLLRELAFSEKTCVTCASCLAVARPFVLSKFF
jgi:KaiC/GvpD/RAD55 family RecA-like ATPase